MLNWVFVLGYVHNNILLDISVCLFACLFFICVIFGRCLDCCVCALDLTVVFAAFICSIFTFSE